MDRGAWQVTVHGVAKSRSQLSDWHFHFLSLGTAGANSLTPVPSFFLSSSHFLPAEPPGKPLFSLTYMQFNLISLLIFALWPGLWSYQNPPNKSNSHKPPVGWAGLFAQHLCQGLAHSWSLISADKRRMWLSNWPFQGIRGWHTVGAQ